jgi:GWxTD domain-containing protein
LLLAFPIAAAMAAALSTPSTAQLMEFDITEERLERLSPAMQREIAGLHYLLNVYQLHQFFASESDEERHRWIERWWRSQNPTPTTSLNEMRVEHDKRVETARIAFGWKGWPGWDRRGEVLIRYGNPEFRHDVDWIVTQVGATPPGEQWDYFRHDMTVIFEDLTHNGKYTFAIQSRGNMDRRRVMGGADPLFGPHADTGKPIDADFDGPRGYPIVPPVNWYYVHLSDEAQERVNNFEAVLEQYPSTYPFNFNRKELPFYYGVEQFKGGESANRVEVDVEFNAVPPALLAGETQKFSVTAVFFDHDFEEVGRLNTEISLPDDAVARHAELWYPAQLVFTLPVDYYRVAVTVEESGSGRSSSYRSTFVAGDFRHDTAISDVLFCSKIAPVGKESPFNRGALEVIPHPRADYAFAASVPVYFEIYNLELDDDGLSSYAVEYWIVPLDKRGDSSDAFAVSRFESSSYGADAPVNVLLDTDNVPAGDHVFHIRVTDLRTLFATERAAVFHVMD